MKFVFIIKIICPKIDFDALKYGEPNSIREENKNFSKALKVQIAEFDKSNNDFEKSIDDEVDLMFRKFKHMTKRTVNNNN